MTADNAPAGPCSDPHGRISADNWGWPMNKYEPITSGLLSTLLQDAAFDGALPGTLSAELARLLPPQTVVSILSRHRRDGGSRIIIHPPQAAGAPQRIDGMSNTTERTFEGTVYCGECRPEDGPSEGVDSHVRLVLHASRQRRIELEFRYPSRRADQVRLELMRLMQAMGPDLVLAFRIAELVKKLTSAERLNHALLDLLPLPALLLDRHGTLRRANAYGMALLSQGTAIIAGADGHIHAVNRASNDEFHEALEGQQVQSGSPTADAAVISVPAGEEQVLITIRQVLTAADHAVDPMTGSALEDEPATILVAQRTKGTLSLTRGILEGAFALTSKEADLAQSLLNGESIGAYALRRRMSKQTLRNQLSGILRKTRTKRQAELIGLLTRLAFAPSI